MVGSALIGHAILLVKNTQKFPVLESLDLEPCFFPRKPSTTESSIKRTGQSSSSITTLDSIVIPMSMTVLSNVESCYQSLLPSFMPRTD